MKTRKKIEKLREAKARSLRKRVTWCVVLLKRHSSIVRLPGRYVPARSAIPSSALSSQGVARGKLRTDAMLLCPPEGRPEYCIEKCVA